jgi:hypothetical protein
LGFVNKQEYDAAKSFYMAVKKGEKRAEAPMSGADGEAQTQSGDIPF